MRAMRHWSSRLSGEALESLFLEIFKTQMDKAQRYLVRNQVDSALSRRLDKITPWGLLICDFNVVQNQQLWRSDRGIEICLEIGSPYIYSTVQEQTKSPSSACYCTSSAQDGLISCCSKASSSLLNMLSTALLHLIVILFTDLLSLFSRDLLFLMIHICSSTVCSVLWKQPCSGVYALFVSARHKTRPPGTSW